MSLTPEVRASLERQGRFDLIRDLSERRPEDVAPFVVYLATDEASNINGRVFRVYAGTIQLFGELGPGKSISKDGRWTLDELLKVMPQTLTTKW
jgi:hypothetical protein